MSALRLIELTEYVPCWFERAELSDDLAQTLWSRYQSQVSVNPPSFQNKHRWCLTSQGWVGYLPVSPDVHLALQPKVPLSSLFGMLEYAYQVGQFLKEGLVQVESVRELYERLALVLARRVLDRGRQGFYRSYISLDERIPYIRGRMDVRRLAQTPWDTRMHCHYQEHTADIEDNQILAWTLFSIARSGVCKEEALPSVRQAFRQMGQVASLEHKDARCCLGRLYHRLNHDYASLHALCRFFLENSGPAHQTGERVMLPFLINMAQLYEKFVAEWLRQWQRQRQPQRWQFRDHQRFTWDEKNGYRSDIDLVLVDGETGETVCVLDTKYKAISSPAENDIHQIIFYAQALGCHEAVLIYPTPLASPTDTWIGDIHLRTLTFALDGDLDEAGERFVGELLRIPYGRVLDASA